MRYIKPDFKTEAFDVEDILTASGGTTTPPEPEEPEQPTPPEITYDPHETPLLPLG